MPDAKTLPHEIILNILEVAARFNREHISILDSMASLTDQLRSRPSDSEPERNAVLSACALVCRAWRGPVQKMLFSDISLGSTFYYDSTDKMRVIGSTEPALKSLIAVLESFKDSRNALLHQIRSIHLVFGLSLHYGNGKSLTQDVVREPLAGHIVRAITICPELIHLNLSLGVARKRSTRSDFLFPPAFLNLLAADRPLNLRQLRITSGTGNTLSVLDSFDLIDERPACEILSVLAPSLTVLDYDVCLDFYDVPEAPELPPLPILHTLYTEGSTPLSSIHTQAPSLRKALMSMKVRARNSVPDHIEELVISHPDDDVSQLKKLKKLALVNFGGPPSAEKPHVLRTLPRSLEHLVLSTISVEYDFIMKMTTEAVRNLPNFKSLILAPRFHDDPSRLRLVNLESYGIPIEVSYTYWQKVFPCAD